MAKRLSLNKIKFRKLKSGSDPEGTSSVSEGAEAVKILSKPKINKKLYPFHKEKLKHR